MKTFSKTEFHQNSGEVYRAAAKKPVKIIDGRDHSAPPLILATADKMRVPGRPKGKK